MVPPWLVAGWISLIGLVVPSWERLESQLPTSPGPIVYFDSLPESAPKDRPILFRDREGICPFSEQIWLALEVKNVDHVTVLIDRPAEEDSWSSPLRIVWPDGGTQTDALEILERLEQEYPRRGPNLFPVISKAVDSVRCNIVRFQGVFPRKTVPNVFAPYLTRRTSADLVQWVPESDHVVTLEETDEVMEEYYQGPFLCGAHITAADIVWAPFLERYAVQLPLVHEGDDLRPRSSTYENILEWYRAMEERVPAYGCRVMGDPATWERLLRRGLQEKRVPDRNLRQSSPGIMATGGRNDDNEVWSQYSSTRPHVAETPQLECVAFYVRNRRQVIADASKALTNMSPDEIERALREVLGAILEGNQPLVGKLSGNARELLSHLDERLCVPRDMGFLPAATLRTLALAAPKPRIASR